MSFLTLYHTFVSFTPILLIVHCVFIFTFKKWLGPVGTFYTSILVFTLVLVTSLVELYSIHINGNYYFVDFGRWFLCLDFIDSHFAFCIDGLGLVAASLVLLLTMFALHFGVEYMYREAFINRLLYLLNLFATSVIFLFFCYDYFLILFAWECIGLFSLLLINFYSTRVYTIKAALKTFVFSRVSDMFMFISFLLVLNNFNTTDLSLIFIQTPFLSFHYIFVGKYALHLLTIFSFCLATSGAIKAAQFFFHVWLPDAMEAPTPASALIHSSTLVVAGVFLIIRFATVFEFTIFTNYYLAILGALTLVFASVTATFQTDIKKLVAYSTISQIGYLISGCGFCCYEEVLIYLIIHAMNKAFLFVLVGYLVHFFAGNTDMQYMGGVYLYSFDITILLVGVCCNLAGLPYSAGFLGKEFLLFQLMRGDFIANFIRSCWLISFFFTPLYMFTLVFLVVFGPKKSNINTYKGVWDFNNRVNHWTRKCKVNYYNILQTDFNFTIITSQLTTYFLFIFWICFYFFGEFLYLVIFNYSTITDTILSSNFLNIKQSIINYTLTVPEYLTVQLSFYLKLMILSALGFLVNLNYMCNYFYFRNNNRLLLIIQSSVLLFIFL